MSTRVLATLHGYLLLAYVGTKYVSISKRKKPEVKKDRNSSLLQRHLTVTAHTFASSIQLGTGGRIGGSRPGISGRI